MLEDREPRRRKRLRLETFDYSTAGAYFVTAVTQDRAPWFGSVLDGAVQLTKGGVMIGDWWLRLESRFDAVELDDFVVMPNHIHGVIWIVRAAQCGRPESGTAQPNVVDSPSTGGHAGPPLRLPDIMGWFKTMTTNAYIRGVGELSWPRFNRRLWQRSYYEHVVRDDEDLRRIREYIRDNPGRWATDEENRTLGLEDRRS